MTRLKPQPRTFGLVLLLLTATLVLSACPTDRLKPSFIQAGVMRDTIFSVEERGLGGGNGLGDAQ